MPLVVLNPESSGTGLGCQTEKGAVEPRWGNGLMKRFAAWVCLTQRGLRDVVYEQRFKRMSKTTKWMRRLTLHSEACGREGSLEMLSKEDAQETG